MSNTFDDLHFIRKDTVNVDMKNRDTYQLVKFLNENNVYYGTFYGFIKSNNCELSNVSLSNCTFYDISGNELDISKLPTKIDEIESDIYTLSDGIWNLSNHLNNTDSKISDICIILSGIGYDMETLSIGLYDLSNTVNEMSSGSVSALEQERRERISQDKMILEITRNLSSDYLTEKNDRISGDLLLADQIAYETKQREREIGALCANMDANNRSIVDLYSKITDITKYKGKLILSSDYDSTESRNGFTQLFVDNGKSIEDTILKNSYYLMDATDKSRHYKINGRKIEDGDFIFITENTTVKGLTDSKVEITDVLDKDVVHKQEFYEASAYLSGKIELEILERMSNDTVLSDMIFEERRTRHEVDVLLTSMINEESETRFKNDYVLSNEIDDVIKQHADDFEYLDERIDSVITSYITSDIELSNALTRESEIRKLSDDYLENKIDVEKAEREIKDIFIQSELENEKYERNRQYVTLTSMIDEVKERHEDDFEYLDERIDSVITSYITSDIELSNALITESEIRYENDSNLSSEMDFERNRITELSDSYITVTADFDERITDNKENIGDLSSTVGDKLKTLYVNISGLLSDDISTDYYHLLSSVIEIKKTLGEIYW